MIWRLPMPWLSLIIFVAWLLLMGEITLLTVIGAAAFAWSLPLASAWFAPEAALAGNPRAIARLTLVVLVDIIKSNIVVARLVLGRPSRLRPTFVTVPVDTDHPYVIALLASIITMTPGTVSARVYETPGRPGSRILVHVLDCENPESIVEVIKSRYEVPLMEIFKCSPLR